MAYSKLSGGARVLLEPALNDWRDVDLSAYIPSNATGVAITVQNGVTTGYNYKMRKPGSTDDLSPYIYFQQIPQYIGVSNRVVQLYRTNNNVLFYLTGYFDSEVVFFDNCIDVSLAGASSWTDIDISAHTGANTAIGAIFLYINPTGNNYNMGFRKNGSTDNRVIRCRSAGVIIGLDANKICEHQVSNTALKTYLVGYVKAGAVFNTNASDVSLGSANTWTALPALAAGASGGLYEVSGSAYNYGLRPKGWDAPGLIRADRITFDLCGCDSNGIIEGWIANTALDFFNVGYFYSTADVEDEVIAEIVEYYDSTPANALGISKTGVFEDEAFNRQMDEIVAKQFHKNQKIRVSFPSAGVIAKVDVGYKPDRFTIIDRRGLMRVWEAPTPSDDKYLYLRSNGTGSVTLMVWKQGG